MNTSRFRSSRTPMPEADGLSASAMLRYILGYDTLTEPLETTVAPAFVAALTSDIDDPQLKADWSALEADGAASVFQSYSWQRGLTTHLLAADAKPLFATIRDTHNNRVAAIFPLQQTKRRGMTVIEYLAPGFCDTCQPLLSPYVATMPDAAGGLIDALIAALPRADILRLAKMQPLLLGLANPFAGLPGCAASPDMTFPVELDARSDGFVGAKSAYKSYQKQWRKLSRREGIAFELFDTPETIATAFDAMIVMRNARFNELNRDDLLNNAEVADFYRRMALLPEADRCVRIAGLKVGDDYKAYIYMMDRNGKFSTVISAMDNTVGNAYAPGLILFTKIFERAVETGYDYGDIGIGFMPYKTRFACAENPLFVWERGLSTRGRAMLGALGMTRAAKHWARKNPMVRAILEKVLKRKIGAHITAREPEPVKSGDED